MIEPDRRRVGAYLQLLRPHLGRWTLATCVLFVGATLNLSLPQAVRVAIDDALSQGSTDSLDALVLGTAGLFLAIAVFAFWRVYLVIWIGARIVADGLTFTNEVRVDGSGQWLYVAETFGRRISRFRIAPTGELSGREISPV